jgi:6-phosphogluconate dehydrogenase
MNKIIGIIGLSTMGGNLAKNFADKNFTVVVFNRSDSKTKELEGINNIVTTYSLKDFYDALGDKKIIMMLVKAGQGTDDTIAHLQEFLKPEDIVVDLGNANYIDSLRRQQLILNYYVCGISGGEKGARYGASLMMSGPKTNSEELKSILSTVAAQDFNGAPTIAYLGETIEGNIVKTVHNGIEYVQMQILSELYSIMRNLGGYLINDIQQAFYNWSEDKSDYLCSVMSQALTDNKLIDNTKPIIESKGTGKWTAQMALENDVYSTLINYSYNIRLIKNDLVFSDQKIDFDKEILSNLYDQAYNFALLEGLEIIKTKSPTVNIEEVKRIWQGGCIIRNKQLANAQKLDYTNYTTLFKEFQTANIPLPVLNMINQYSKINIYGLEGAALLAIARDVFGNHGFYNLENEKVYLDW